MIHLTVMFRILGPLCSSVKRGGKLLFSEKYLLYTNIGLSIGISGVGDVFQQYYQRRKDGSHSQPPWDYMRTAKMAASGILIGPFIHYWYQHLDVWFPGRCLKNLSKKVFMDLAISSPICVFLFLLVTGILDGQGWRLMKHELKNTGKDMFVIDTLVWTPGQAFNFYFLPTRFRILFDNTVSLVIDTYFSYLRFGENSSYQQHQTKSATESKDFMEIQPNAVNVELGSKVVSYDSNVVS